jgi:CheY-like chemotaxis protein
MPPNGSGLMPASRRRLPSPHLLVMDTHPEMLDVLGQLFQDEGYLVTLSSRMLTTDDFGALNPGVIVIDVNDHGSSDAWKLIRQLRTDIQLRAIPLICCATSRTLSGSAGLDGLPTFLKPFDLDDLLQAVTEQDVGKRQWLAGRPTRRTRCTFPHSRRVPVPGNWHHPAGMQCCGGPAGQRNRAR